MECNHLQKKLIKTKLFYSVDENDLWIPKIGYIKEYREDEIIISEGQNISCIGIILNGDVDVMKMFLDGRQVHVNVLGENNLIGLDSVYGFENLSLYYYIAKVPTKIFFVPFENIFKVGYVKEKVRICMLTNIIKVLAHEHKRQNQKLNILSSNSVRHRVSMYLSYQESKHRSSSFEIPFNREEMAEYLCVNRSALSRELSRLKRDGVLDYDKNKFVLKNRSF
ncbi:MAG: Crp/Fnr family transcriptional regulator [Lachnospirales bacterium]